MDGEYGRNVGMRRTLVVICVALLGATVVAGAGAAVTRAAVTDPLPPTAELLANQHAAQRDARTRLQLIQLPATDIMPTRTIPAFAKSFEPISSPRGTYASAQHWEVASAHPKAIIAYVRKHPPAGSTADPGTGTSSDSKTGVSSTDVEFSWPDVPGQLLNRTATVIIVTPRHGHPVVIVQSQAAWFVPRPAGERVPSDVQAIAITLRLSPGAEGPVMRPGGHTQTSRYEIWRAARARALVNLINGLPIVQPAVGPLACPMMLTGSAASELTLAFQSGRGGKTLAKAQVYIHRGTNWTDGGGVCDPINLWIAGKQQTPLTSPSFVKQIGALVGTKIS
jgi:hypothetical protein